jgi:excisionase family DNA binding protein
MTTAEVVEAYGITRQTLDRWVAEGKLAVIQPIPRGTRRFVRSDLEQMFAPQVRPARTADP